jgi:hypothetical protein
MSRHVSSTFLRVLGIIGSSGVIGCNAASQDAPATKASEPTNAVEAPAPAEAVRSLVPPGLAAKLKFESRELRDQFDWNFKVLAPAGWPQNEGYASLRPSDEDTWGTKFYLSHTCAGACVVKDWAAVTDGEEFAKLAQEKVAQDEKTPTSRLMISNTKDITTVKYASWTAHATGYWTCTALLKAPYREAAPAFARACQSATATKTR